MKIAILAAFIAAVSLPAAASAQVVGQPVMQGQGQRAPGAHAYNRWMKRLQPIGLSAQQMQQVQNVLGQYAQQHPEGSPKDPQASHALRAQIFGILTPDQQARLQQEMRTMKMERRARRDQEQPQQAPPPAR
jgi:Spy/CpxP family protein refolding chaperone